MNRDHRTTVINSARVALALVAAFSVYASQASAGDCSAIFRQKSNYSHVGYQETLLLELAHLKLAAYEASEKGDRSLAETLNNDFERQYHYTQSLGLPVKRVQTLINRDRHLNAEARLKKKARLHEAALSDDSLRPWRAAHKFSGEIFRGEHDAHAAAFSPDGTRVVTSGMTTLTVSDAVTRKELFTLRNFPGKVDTVFSPDGKKALAISYHDWRLFNTTTGEVTMSNQTLGTSFEVMSAAYSPDGAQIALGLSRGGAVLVDLSSGTQLHVFDVDTFTASARYSPEGSKVVFDNYPKYWVIDAKSGKKLHTPKSKPMAHHDFVPEFSPDGKKLITAVDQSLFVSDAATGKKSREINGGHKGRVIAIGFKANLLIYSSEKGDLIVWDMHENRKIVQLEQNDSKSIRSIAFNRQSTRMATTFQELDGVEKDFAIWDTSSDDPAKWRIIAHLEEDWISDAKFSPDGQSILTSSGTLWQRVEVNRQPGSK